MKRIILISIMLMVSGSAISDNQEAVETPSPAEVRAALIVMQKFLQSNLAQGSSDEELTQEVLDVTEGLAPLVGLVTDGIIESTSGGFRFPDGTLQPTAANDAGISQSDADSRYINAYGDTLTGVLNVTNSLRSGSAVIGGGNIFLNADGSAGFAGGSPLFYADGAVSFAGGDIFFGSNGSAGFAEASFGNGTNAFARNGTVYLGNASSTFYPGGKVTFAAGNIVLAADGNATFAAGNIVLAADGGAAFGNGSSVIYPDGRATFAGGATFAMGDIVLGADGISTFGNGSSVIYPEGTATFAAGNIVLAADGGAAFGNGASVIYPSGKATFGHGLTTINSTGRLTTKILEIVGGSDIAEPFDIAADDQVSPGMVVVIDPDRPGGLRLADQPYDRRVAGIVSGAGGVNTGLTLSQDGTEATGQYPVALTGRVYAHVDADANGPVQPGDLLTTSSTLGYAMRASHNESLTGAVLGKAITSLDSGKGLVLVLVALQ